MVCWWETYSWIIDNFFVIKQWLLFHNCLHNKNIHTCDLLIIIAIKWILSNSDKKYRLKFFQLNEPKHDKNQYYHEIIALELFVTKMIPVIASSDGLAWAMNYQQVDREQYRGERNPKQVGFWVGNYLLWWDPRLWWVLFLGADVSQSPTTHGMEKCSFQSQPHHQGCPCTVQAKRHLLHIYCPITMCLFPVTSYAGE